MNKKLLQLLFISILCGSSVSPFFDDLFKGIDFDKLAKDVESMLQEEEKSGNLQPPLSSQEPSKPFGLGQQKPLPTQQPQAKQDALLTPIPSTRMDKKSLFLDPIAIAKGDARQKPTYLFPQQKLDAFIFYKNELIEELKHVEREADLPGVFSIEFKEQFMHYKKTIDTIVVAMEFIADRKFYVRAFFLPQFNELRKKVVEAIDRLYQLNKRIDFKVYAGKQTEKSRQEGDITLLQKRALQRRQKSPQKPNPINPTHTKKQFHRGKPVQTPNPAV